MKKIIFLLLIILLPFLAFKWWYAFNLASAAGTGDAEGQEIVIESGASVNEIARLLKEKDAIRSELAFKLHIKQADLANKLQAGSYLVNPGMNAKEIARIIAAGQALIDEREIKFIEGWTLKDMDAYLAGLGQIRAGEFLAAAQAGHGFDFLDSRPAGFDLEGFVFPDTYRIYNSAGPLDILNKALANFDAKLAPELRAEISRQNKSIWEIMTMASLIEKEVRGYEDMRLVSGVFWNRLAIDQALESCASLAYILGVNKKQYTLEDTKVDSIYNTYLYPGLPPGPVCNPGLNAIKAAIYPAASDYYYFLSRADNGETVFARTYQEHLDNKAKYLP